MHGVCKKNLEKRVLEVGILEGIAVRYKTFLIADQPKVARVWCPKLFHHGICSFTYLIRDSTRSCTYQSHTGSSKCLFMGSCRKRIEIDTQIPNLEKVSSTWIDAFIQCLKRHENCEKEMPVLLQRLWHQKERPRFQVNPRNRHRFYARRQKEMSDPIQSGRCHILRLGSN